LQTAPSPRHVQEAQAALRELVVLPYYVTTGESLEQVPASMLARPASEILGATGFMMKGRISGWRIEGVAIPLASDLFNGREVLTKDFGVLRCLTGPMNFGDNPSITLLCGGTREQRDGLMAFIEKQIHPATPPGNP
jgi:hypothetical protein